MLAPTKKRHIKNAAKITLRVCYENNVYNIPRDVVERYREVDSDASDLCVAQQILEPLLPQLPKAAILLRGLRYRENLSQIEFAKLIQVSQADLSKMENGKRSIGRNIAKRIAEQFAIDYRYFLE